MNARTLQAFSEELLKLGSMGPAMLDFEAKAKDNSPYQHGRDWAWRGAQGAAAGAGLTKLVKDMVGKGMKPSSFRRGAGIGAGIAVGDKAWRYHKKERDKPKGVEKTALVQPSMGGKFTSPASALSESSRTGKFNSKVLHNTGTPSKTLQLGKKFRFAGVR